MKFDLKQCNEITLLFSYGSKFILRTDNKKKLNNYIQKTVIYFSTIVLWHYCSCILYCAFTIFLKFKIWNSYFSASVCNLKSDWDVFFYFFIPLFNYSNDSFNGLQLESEENNAVNKSRLHSPPPPRCYFFVQIYGTFGLLTITGGETCSFTSYKGGWEIFHECFSETPVKNS